MYLFFLPLFSHTPWFEQNYANVFTAVTLKTQKYLGFKLSGKHNSTIQYKRMLPMDLRVNGSFQE